MNKERFNERSNEDKGQGKETVRKAAGDRSAEQKGKSKKHDGKDGAVLRDLNDDAKKD